MFNISSEGVEFIKREEGTRLTPYRDTAGNWTIGTGHLIRSDEGYLMNGITEGEADDLLYSDLAAAGAAINSSVYIPLPQSAVDALYSLAFNIGAHALKSSELIKMINQGAPLDGIRDRWTSHYITAGGAPSDSLHARRAREFDLYASGSGQGLSISDLIVPALLSLIGLTLLL